MICFVFFLIKKAPLLKALFIFIKYSFTAPYTPGLAAVGLG